MKAHIETEIWNDEEIIQQVIAGDKDQFAFLVKRYERLVFSITLRFLRNNTLAEDAAQETFLKAYLHLPSYSSAYRFSTWISRIAQNVCIDMHRKKRPDAPIEEAATIADAAPLPVEQVMAKEQSAAISKELDALAPIYREPLMLYHDAGLQYDEIAKRLDIPMSMVKNRIFRARRALKQTMKSVLS